MAIFSQTLNAISTSLHPFPPSHPRLFALPQMETCPELPKMSAGTGVNGGLKEIINCRSVAVRNILRTSFSDEICQALSFPNVGTFVLVFLRHRIIPKRDSIHSS